MAGWLAGLPDAVAVTDSRGGTMTYAELSAALSAVPSAARSLGIEANDRVAMVVRHDLTSVVALLGLMRHATVIPLAPDQPDEVRRRRAERAGASRFLRSPDELLLPEPSRLDARAARPSTPDVDSRHVGLLLPTSGTTSVARLVPLTVGMLSAGAAAVVASTRLGPDDRGVNVLPLTHVGGIVDLLLAPLASGGRVHLAGPFDAATCWASLVDATWWQAAPAILSALLDARTAATPALPDLKFVRSVSAPLPSGLRERAESELAVPVIEIYGMTETAGVICSQSIDDRRPGSVGLPVATDVRLVDEHGASASSGEVQVRGTQVLAGYASPDRQTLDRSAFDGDWLRTGDVGRLDDDGHLFLVGRIKEMVNHGGEKVAPTDVDEVLLAHPGVVDAAAFAVPHPTLGEVVAAVVVAAHGHELALPALQAHVASFLPRSHVPRRVGVVETIPRTNGKLRRTELPALLEVSSAIAGSEADRQRSPEPARDSRGQQVRQWLAAVWCRALDVADSVGVRHDADFFAAGGDSLRAAAVVAEVSDVAGELVYVSSIYDYPTIAAYEVMLSTTYPVTWSRLAGTAPPPVAGRRPVDDEARTAFAAGMAHGERPSTSTDGERLPVLDRLALVVSAPRSGSTLLRAMLAGHPALFAPPELYLLPFDTMRQRRAAFDGPVASQREGLERAWMGATGCDATAARAWVESLEDADAPTAAAYRALADATPGRILVDKTPMNALRPAWLRRAQALATDLRIVHLVRHPAAVAESFAEARLGALWWPRMTATQDLAVPGALAGAGEEAFGELLWEQIERTIDELRSRIRSDRWGQVRFEELVAEPRPSMATVCQILGVAWDESVAAAVLDPYGRGADRMTDGLHRQSRMIGDPKFSRYDTIDATRGGRGDASARPLAASTQDLAATRGYRVRPRAITDGQRRLWKLSRLSPGDAPHVVPVAYNLGGTVDVPRLEKALAAVVARHDSLRTAFPATSAGEPAPIVLPAGPVVLPVTDLRWIRRQNDPASAQAELDRQVRAEVGKPFDLEHGPLWRGRLLRVADDETLLVLGFHRLAFDGASRTVFEADLSHAFGGDLLPSAPPAGQVADALNARSQARTRDDEAAWTDALAGLQGRTILPVEHRDRSSNRAAVDVTLDLPDDLTTGIRSRAAAGGPTVAAWWLAATMLALFRRTGQRDLVAQVPTAGRSVPPAQDTVGGWSTLVPARVQIDPEQPRSAVLSAAHAALAFAVDHDGLPRDRILTSNPLAAGPLLVSVQHRRGSGLSLGPLAVRPFRVRRPVADADLAIHLEVTPDGASATADANGDLITAASLDDLLTGIVDELRRCLDAEDEAVGPSAASSTDDVVAALRAVPGVDDAAAVIDPGEGRALAVVVLDEEGPADRETVSAALSTSLPAYRVPARVRSVDVLPTRSDGSLDENAVADLARAGEAADVANGPSNELESVIARAWQDVLWRDEPVDVGVSFRDYGGHSLLAVQLVVELEQRLARPLPPAALAHLDTVAGLARAIQEEPAAASARSEGDLPTAIISGLLAHTATWEGDRHRVDAVIVGRNTVGARTPLFWCLQNEREHRALADGLGPDQPLFALRSGNRVMVKSDDNLDRLADHYVQEIREIRPDGPYLLGGNCQAARIALRIARRLRAEGAEVPVLFMMEKFEPLTYDGAVSMLFGDRSDRNPFRRFSDPGRGYANWYRGPLWIREIQGAHAQFFTPENAPVLAARVAEHLAYADGGPCPPGLVPTRSDADALPETAYRAHIRVSGPGLADVQVGSGHDLDIVVRNTSDTPWPAAPRSGLGVAARWLGPDGRPEPVASVSSLTPSVDPGEEVPVHITVPAPAVPGAWTLELDVVDEGVAWFGERGSTPRHLAVDVRAERGPRRWRRR